MSLFGLLAIFVGAMPLAARAETNVATTDNAVTTDQERSSHLGLALSTGSAGSPLSHLGLELQWEHRRLEAFVGVGLFVGDTCREEGHPPLDQCLHPVAALGTRYAVLRRRGFELAPGLGLSFQPAHHEEQLTRPGYGTTTWDWRWSLLAPRLNMDLQARYRAGAWSFGVVGGAGVMLATMDECTATNMGNLWTCSNVPSPAYAAPTPFAVTAYGQLVVGRDF